MSTCVFGIQSEWVPTGIGRPTAGRRGMQARRKTHPDKYIFSNNPKFMGRLALGSHTRTPTTRADANTTRQRAGNQLTAKETNGRPKSGVSASSTHPFPLPPKSCALGVKHMWRDVPLDVADDVHNGVEGPRPSAPTKESTADCEIAARPAASAYKEVRFCGVGNKSIVCFCKSLVPQAMPCL